ncbi:energy transducer TonB [Hymenobacter caeli]|uniref:Outer membrane biosynthesis protein TonB n=1 Tax=Hymenobacter caeli TaxID=2735894 RepID=A0ABX2FPH5_9BACT|nr:energy transducer TonB [Hymenobacter caeli]NRT18862.1 outer membrane biosynthesis protein TonB [Hymenobacter caeli]
MPPAADLLRAALAAPRGPHPAADTLRQYAAGALAPAQQHLVEAHALDCPRCADVLAGLAQTDAAATDQALATLRRRLHARVAEEAAPRPAAGAWHWPRLAAAAAVVAGLAGGGLWEWQRRAAPAEVATVAAPPAAEAPAAVLDGAPAPAPAAAAAPAASAPTVAAAPAKPRPAAVVAYDPQRRATRKSVLSNADHEDIMDMRAVADDAAARPPAPAAMEAAAPKAAADSVLRLSKVAVSQAQPASAPAAKSRALMGRVAGVAVVPTMPTESTAVAQRLAFTAPANSAVVGAMPAGPALAPAPVGGLGPLREQLRRAAAEFVPEEMPLKGNVRVRFTVGSDGKISNLKVVRGLRPDYDAEALRLVCEGPGWVPGVAGGRRAALPVELNVVF